MKTNNLPPINARVRRPNARVNDIALTFAEHGIREPSKAEAQRLLNEDDAEYYLGRMAAVRAAIAAKLA